MRFPRDSRSDIKPREAMASIHAPTIYTRVLPKTRGPPEFNGVVEFLVTLNYTPPCTNLRLRDDLRGNRLSNRTGLPAYPRSRPIIAVDQMVVLPAPAVVVAAELQQTWLGLGLELGLGLRLVLGLGFSRPVITGLHSPEYQWCRSTLPAARSSPQRLDQAADSV